MQIKSDVVDIRSILPIPDDSFVVDTNIWNFVAGTRASQEKNYQTEHYPRYLKAAKHRKAKLFVPNCVFSELIHSLEKTELDVFNRDQNPKILPKEFRRMVDQRKIVLEEISGAFQIVLSFAERITQLVNETAMIEMLEIVKQHPLDSYDALILLAMKNKGIHRIITDDKDYLSYPGIEVHTANQGVITDARAQNKLVTYGTNIPT